MAESESKGDPRFKNASEWRYVLSNLLGEQILRAYPNGLFGIEILDFKAEEGTFRLRTRDGFFNIRVEVSF